jgi:lysophospholipase L1-like esterase
LHGIAGVSFNAHRAGEASYLTADAAKLELHYWRQPGGGALAVYANGQPLQTVSTDGPHGLGVFEAPVSPGPQRFEVQTLDDLPVRLLGWVTEKTRGVTVEPLGINGAQVGIFRNWNQELLANQVARRSPGLILLAYGTNEASNRDLTYENYKATVSGFLKQLRKAAPTASILVLGPPDRMSRTRAGAVPFPGFSRIVQAQRDAARENGCAFWDLQERMGGIGSLQRWVTAGAAQWDYVHFTVPGYRLIGTTLFNDLMDAYVGFLQARQRIFSSSAGLTSTTDNFTNIVNARE